MPTHGRRPLPAVLLATTILLAACGSGGALSSATNRVASPDTIEHPAGLGIKFPKSVGEFSIDWSACRKQAVEDVLAQAKAKLADPKVQQALNGPEFEKLLEQTHDPESAGRFIESLDELKPGEHVDRKMIYDEVGVTRKPSDGTPEACDDPSRASAIQACATVYSSPQEAKDAYDALMASAQVAITSGKVSAFCSSMGGGANRLQGSIIILTAEAGTGSQNDNYIGFRDPTAADFTKVADAVAAVN